MVAFFPFLQVLRGGEIVAAFRFDALLCGGEVVVPVVLRLPGEFVLVFFRLSEFSFLLCFSFSSDLGLVFLLLLLRLSELNLLLSVIFSLGFDFAVLLLPSLGFSSVLDVLLFLTTGL